MLRSIIDEDDDAIDDVDDVEDGCGINEIGIGWFKWFEDNGLFFAVNSVNSLVFNL